MSALYGADPKWVRLHAALMDPRPDLTASERMLHKIQLAYELHDVEAALDAKRVTA